MGMFQLAYFPLQVQNPGEGNPDQGHLQNQNSRPGKLADRNRCGLGVLLFIQELDTE